MVVASACLHWQVIRKEAVAPEIMSKRPRYFWKGKLVTETVYNHNLTKVANGLKRRKLSSPPRLGEDEKKTETVLDEVSVPNPNGDCLQEINGKGEADSRDFLKGRRIVELAVLANNLWCGSCKELLSLENIEGETRRGMGSILNVRCHKCLLINQVPTGKQHAGAFGRRNRFDVNSKAVIGVLQAGLGWSHLNKILSCLNIPTIEFKTFKRYEREMGPIVESVARDSCREAAE